jgi:hypothetical protein
MESKCSEISAVQTKLRRVDRLTWSRIDSQISHLATIRMQDQEDEAGQGPKNDKVVSFIGDSKVNVRHHLMYDDDEKSLNKVRPIKRHKKSSFIS